MKLIDTNGRVCVKKENKKLIVGNAPAGLLRKTELYLSDEKERIREDALSEIAETDFKYYCAICLIIKDENEYLKEWLSWHIKQGVEHFYIYDHASKESVKDFVRSLGEWMFEKVTVIDWNGKHKDAQPEAYNHCLKNYKKESRWIGFLDVDEQVRVKNGKSLHCFLKKYENYAGVFAVWITYGANNHVKKENKTLRERFTKVSTADDWANRAGKVFVQATLMREMVIHNGSPQIGFDIVDENKNVVEPYALTVQNPSTEAICVDHYYTKSYEEWLEKIKRGSAHSKYSRKYESFFKINPEMEYCREDIIIEQEYEKS